MVGTPLSANDNNFLFFNVLPWWSRTTEPQPGALECDGASFDFIILTLALKTLWCPRYLNSNSRSLDKRESSHNCYIPTEVVFFHCCFSVTHRTDSVRISTAMRFLELPHERKTPDALHDLATCVTVASALVKAHPLQQCQPWAQERNSNISCKPSLMSQAPCLG
jgi:hypothetical protein